MLGDRCYDHRGRLGYCPGLLVLAEVNSDAGVKVKIKLQPVNRLSVGIFAVEIVLQDPEAAGLIECDGSPMNDGLRQPRIAAMLRVQQVLFRAALPPVYSRAHICSESEGQP